MDVHIKHNFMVSVCTGARLVRPVCGPGKLFVKFELSRNDGSTFGWISVDLHCDVVNYCWKRTKSLRLTAIYSLLDGGS